MTRPHFLVTCCQAQQLGCPSGTVQWGLAGNAEVNKTRFYIIALTVHGMLSCLHK
jgi:hypothetical protein